MRRVAVGCVGMMGRSHAVSGVVGWVGLCAASTAFGREPSLSTVLTGAGVAAGFALLPDADHTGSTVARSLGPLTKGLARVVSWVADWVQDRTCPCCRDEDTVAHRAGSHTAVAAVAVGVLVAVAGWRLGRPAAAAVVGLSVALAALGALPARRSRALQAVMFGGVAAALTFELGPAGGWWWLGVPAGFGMFAHIVGDGLTKSAVPLWFPLKIRGCRWRRVGSPRWLRFRTGGLVERWLVGPLMLAALVGSCWVLAT